MKSLIKSHPYLSGVGLSLATNAVCNSIAVGSFNLRDFGLSTLFSIPFNIYA